MKCLAKYTVFDLATFLAEKELTAVGCSPWLDHATGAVLGTRVDVAITHDDTEYPPAKDGSTQSNLYERFSVKVAKEVTIPIGAIVTIIDGNGTVYGDFRNQLSVRAADVRVVNPPAKGAEKAA